MSTFVEPQIDSRRGNVVVFVALLKELVKELILLQFVEERPQLNSGMTLQPFPFVPVDFIMMNWATSMNTIFTVGGVAGVTMLRVPDIAP